MRELLRLLRYAWARPAPVVAIVLLSFVVAQLSVVSIGTVGPLFALFFQEKPLENLVDLGQKGFFGGLGAHLNAWAVPLVGWAQANRVKAVALVMGFLVLMTFLKGVGSFFQEYLTGIVAGRVGVVLSDELYDHTLHLSLGNYTRRGVADPVTRFTVDIDAVVTGVATLFGKAIREPITFLMFLFLLIGISPRLTLTVFIIVPALVAVAAVIGKQIKRAMRRVLAVRTEMVRRLQESFRGIRIVKAFVMEPVEEERFHGLNERLFRMRRRIYAGDAGVSPLLELLGVMGASVVVVLAAQAVAHADLDPKRFLVFAGGLLFLLSPVRMLSAVNNRVQVMLAAAERIFELCDELPQVRERAEARGLAPLREAIRFEDVHFSYNGQDEVLRGISLEVRRGECVALVGASGVGKTTLVNLIPRFYDPTAGRITVDGSDLRDVTLRALRAQVGLVSQEVLLFSDTVRGNIAYGNLRASEADIREAARKAYADEFIRQFPDGYDTLIGEDATTLSGGQRQRIALARAILKDPSIFILDEATSQLDSESEHYIQQALAEFRRGRTTFIIAHRLSTVERADRIVLMEGGRIADIGTHAELLTRSPLYRNLYQLQFSS
jgi:subfamily B ATP-binding cassette protein MsbA